MPDDDQSVIIVRVRDGLGFWVAYPCFCFVCDEFFPLRISYQCNREDYSGKSADSKAISTGDPSLSDSLVCWSSHLWRGWQVRRRHNQRISARAALVSDFFLSGLIFAEIAYMIDDGSSTFTVDRRMSVWRSRSLFSSPITPIGYVERHQTIIMIT